VDWVVIRGKYRRYPTKWYIWSDGRKVKASTRKAELPGPPQGVVRLWKGDYKLVVACPSCRAAHSYWLWSDLKKKVAERAKDCKEFKELWGCFRRYRELVIMALEGDPGTSKKAEKHAKKAKTKEQATTLLRIAEIFGLQLSEKTRARLIAKAL